MSTKSGNRRLDNFEQYFENIYYFYHMNQYLYINLCLAH